tara:strand:- start:824 stop:2047 length:1224 start_codon:yes stop_codon:yes gene_type:complete
MTVSDASAQLGLRKPQVQGWVSTGYVVTCKVGRRRMVSLQSCREYHCEASLRGYHSRGASARPSPEPAPAVVCEMVPMRIGGSPITGARLDGQEVIAVQYLEDILGLRVGSLAKQMRRRDDYVPGVHMFNLSAPQMRAYRREVRDKIDETSHIDSAPTLTVLTAAGVNIAFMMGHSDICRRLRHEISVTGFMVSVGGAIITGDRKKFADAMSGGTGTEVDKLSALEAKVEMLEARLAQADGHRSAIHDKVLNNTADLTDLDARVDSLPDAVAGQVVEQMRPYLEKQQRSREQAGDPFAPPPMRPGEDPHHYCNKSARAVVTAIRQNLPKSERGKVTEAKVRQVGKTLSQQYWAKRRQPYINQGLPGHINRATGRWNQQRNWYSNAFILKTLRYFQTGQVYMFDGDRR